MPHDVGGLRKVLGDFQSTSGAQASAIVSRSGVPIAWVLPEDAHVDNFGTMSATLVGALDVIYSGLHRAPPERIVVRSEDGFLVTQNLTPGAFFVALSDEMTPKLEAALTEATKQAKSYLGSEEV